MAHDKFRVEDINTRMEDHAADTVRYGCMSRPYAGPGPDTPDEDPWKPPTIDEWIMASRTQKGTGLGRRRARI